MLLLSGLGSVNSNDSIESLLSEQAYVYMCAELGKKWRVLNGSTHTAVFPIGRDVVDQLHRLKDITQVRYLAG